MLTVTGQDCAAGKSVGCFVSQAIDRVVDKRLLAGMSWQGTATKWPFSAFEYVIDAVKSEKYSYFLNCLMSQSACTCICILAFCRGNAGELPSTWPSNRRISSSEDKEEDWQ